jgi:WS/DGAT/MGAT family acyltransferase
MASADTAWLHMDRPTNLMVVNCVFWFDGQLDWDAVARAFAERLVPSFPRFAQRAVDPPVTIGLIVPMWQDVDGFDVDDHLVRATLPAPGGDEQLHAYVSAQADVPLDSARPLWQAHLIDGYRSGGESPGCAILLRTHHAMADGTALVQALLTLVDTPASGGHPDQLPRPSSVPPAPESSLASRVITAARQVGEKRAMLHRLGFGRHDDPSPLRGPLSGRKRLTWSSAIPLEPVRAAGRRSGATVNDLALTAVTGALRRYLEQHGVEVERLTAVVPINLRPLDQPMDPLRGNQFGLAFVPLPVSEPDGARRLAAVHAAMGTVKATGEGVVTSGALAVMGHAPTAVEQKFLDVFAGRATAVVTNIAGPREQVSLAGVPLRGFTAWVPSTGPVGVGLAICSYAGELQLGVAVDEALVPDSEVLLEALREEVSALRELAVSAG